MTQREHLVHMAVPYQRAAVPQRDHRMRAVFFGRVKEDAEIVQVLLLVPEKQIAPQVIGAI